MIQPIVDFPPSSINLILFPKSSLTSDEQTELTFVDKFALGAAKGKFKFFNKFLVIGCLGNLTASEFLLLVAILEIFEFFFKSKIKVIGPGQNLWYNLIKSLLNSQSFLNFWWLY